MTTNCSDVDDSVFYVLCKASHIMFQLWKGFRDISLVDILRAFSGPKLLNLVSGEENFLLNVY